MRVTAVKFGVDNGGAMIEAVLKSR